jgi:hypothetical protein
MDVLETKGCSIFDTAEIWMPFKRVISLSEALLHLFKG